MVSVSDFILLESFWIEWMNPKKASQNHLRRKKPSTSSSPLWTHWSRTIFNLCTLYIHSTATKVGVAWGHDALLDRGWGNHQYRFLFLVYLQLQKAKRTNRIVSLQPALMGEELNKCEIQCRNCNWFAMMTVDGIATSSGSTSGIAWCCTSSFCGFGVSKIIWWKKSALHWKLGFFLFMSGVGTARRPVSWWYSCCCYYVISMRIILPKLLLVLSSRLLWWMLCIMICFRSGP